MAMRAADGFSLVELLIVNDPAACVDGRPLRRHWTCACCIQGSTAGSPGRSAASALCRDTAPATDCISRRWTGGRSGRWALVPLLRRPSCRIASVNDGRTPPTVVSRRAGRAQRGDLEPAGAARGRIRGSSTTRTGRADHGFDLFNDLHGHSRVLAQERSVVALHRNGRLWSGRVDQAQGALLLVESSSIETDAETTAEANARRSRHRGRTSFESPRLGDVAIDGYARMGQQSDRSWITL